VGAAERKQFAPICVSVNRPLSCAGFFLDLLHCTFKAIDAAEKYRGTLKQL
jgi:hypothetical protein